MPTTSKFSRLKGHLSAQRKAMNTLATATRRLHQTMDRMIDAAEARDGTAAKKRAATKGPKPKSSGDSASPPGAPRRAKGAKPRRVDTPPPAALERHWGNLF